MARPVNTTTPVQASLLGRASRVARSYFFFFGNSAGAEDLFSGMLVDVLG